jgi:hypothetical protein
MNFSDWKKSKESNPILFDSISEIIDLKESIISDIESIDSDLLSPYSQKNNSDSPLSDSPHSSQKNNSESPHKTTRGWKNLDKQWERTLSSDNFVFKDVKGDGNCQFRAIELAFKSQFKHRELRKMISNYILSPKFTNERFKNILEFYKLEQDNGDFEGNWDPSKIKTRIQLANQIKKAGFNFQGDNTTLSILSDILKVDFIIFSDFRILQLSTIHPKIIILLYTDSHYQIIGHKENKKVNTIFNRDSIPNDIVKLIDKELYLKDQLDKCWNASQNDPSICNFTLNEIYNYIQNKVINRKLLQDERIIVAKLLKSYINLINVSTNKKKAKY